MTIDDEEALKAAGKRLGDISDLPEALRKQIKTARLDEIEENILKTIKDRFGGLASVDEIMVGLYRDFGHVTEDRSTLVGKLYRMTKAGHLESVPKRKGIVRLKR